MISSSTYESIVSAGVDSDQSWHGIGRHRGEQAAGLELAETDRIEPKSVE